MFDQASDVPRVNDSSLVKLNIDIWRTWISDPMPGIVLMYLLMLSRRLVPNVYVFTKMSLS